MPPTPHDRYFEIVLDKIEGDRYPSKQMLDRVLRLAQPG